MTDLNAAIGWCVDEVRLANHVTFVEVRTVLESHEIPARGDQSMELSKCPNLLLWAGMSEQFLTVAGALYDHPHIELRPTGVLTYIVDGEFLTLPVAKRPPQRGYRQPHWAPCVFCWVGPPPTADELRGDILAGLR